MCNVKNQTQIYKALCQRKKMGGGFMAWEV